MLKKYSCSAKMKNIEEETLDITNLATNTTLNAKINEIKSEMPSITNLSTTVALTTIKHLVLVIQSKKQNMMQKDQKCKIKYFTISDYNKCMSNTLDAKITQKSQLMMMNDDDDELFLWYG